MRTRLVLVEMAAARRDVVAMVVLSGGLAGAGGSGAVDSGGGADNSGADGSGNSGSSGGDTQRGFSFSQVAGSL